MAAPVRIGLLTPSSNTCLEPVAAALVAPLADEVSLHVSRVGVQRIALDGGSDRQFATEQMLAAARLLADAEVSVLVWAGTAGSWLGVDGDRELAGTLEDELGIPATTSTLAMLDAFGLYGVRRFGLAVPYTDDVSERIVAEYARAGFACSSVASLGISRNLDFDDVSSERILRLIRDAAVGSDAVGVVCTNLRGAPHVARLEAELGTFVVDSVTATMWQALERAGRPASLPGFGDLALNGSLRSRLGDTLERLRVSTNASRTTVRLDVPERGLHVDQAAAESCETGVAPIRHDRSLNQWAMPTVQWVASERRTLVQNAFDGSGPPVVPELIQVYGVQAQMLHPVVREGAVIGWVSVHQVGAERPWSRAEIDSIAGAASEIEAVLHLE